MDRETWYAMYSVGRRAYGRHGGGPNGLREALRLARGLGFGHADAVGPYWMAVSAKRMGSRSYVAARVVKELRRCWKTGLV